MRRVFGAGDYQYEVLENWGRSGERPKFGLVSSVAVDSQDNVYVFQRNPEAVMLVFESGWNAEACLGTGHLRRTARRMDRPGRHHLHWLIHLTTLCAASRPPANCCGRSGLPVRPAVQGCRSTGRLGP